MKSNLTDLTASSPTKPSDEGQKERNIFWSAGDTFPQLCRYSENCLGLWDIQTLFCIFPGFRVRVCMRIALGIRSWVVCEAKRSLIWIALQLLIKRDFTCSNELGTYWSLMLTDKLSLKLTCLLFQVLSSTKGTNCCFLLGWSPCTCNYAISVCTLFAGEAGIFHSKMK